MAHNGKGCPFCDRQPWSYSQPSWTLHGTASPGHPCFRQGLGWRPPVVPSHLTISELSAAHDQALNTVLEAGRKSLCRLKTHKGAECSLTTSVHSAPLDSHLLARKCINQGQGTANFVLVQYGHGSQAQKNHRPCASSRYNHPSRLQKALLAFPKQGVCPWFSEIPKTVLLMGADSGTNSIQETSRLPGSASKERCRFAQSFLHCYSQRSCAAESSREKF